MKARYRIVIPFRPFPPESPLHRELADFDWLAALQMVVHSARLSCRMPVHAITDESSELPVPALRYPTRSTRLMLWLVEACLSYLESDDFDRDTVMLDVDQLVYGELGGWFGKADLTVLVRTSEKHLATDSGWPLLNGVQFWRHRARRRLVAFYQRAYDVAQRLPEARLIWGADTDAVRTLIEPIALGKHERSGVTVSMVDARRVLNTLTAQQIETLQSTGRIDWPHHPVVDFRWQRKVYMRAVYEATILDGALR